MIEISGHTGLVALLGSPVEHSLSPAIHNESFKRLGIDAVYLVSNVTPETLGDAIRGARALGTQGLNITMPCKTAVLDHLDALSPAAGSSVEHRAAVFRRLNCLYKRRGDLLTGHDHRHPRRIGKHRFTGNMPHCLLVW